MGTDSKIVAFFSVLLTLTFIGLKLCGAIAWSWWWSLSPAWLWLVEWSAYIELPLFFLPLIAILVAAIIARMELPLYSLPIASICIAAIIICIVKIML